MEHKMAENEVLMYCFLYENRMYRVALEESDLRSLNMRPIQLAEFIIDLQTRKFIKYRGDVESITTSNPFYNIIMGLPLISFTELKKREPLLFL